LRALGYSPADAGRVLRFSAGWETTVSDWDALLRALSTIAKQAPEPGQKMLAKSAAAQ
jgi:cysteine sulfinate desulfinase/cysteine desulfurase-like protein